MANSRTRRRSTTVRLVLDRTTVTVLVLCVPLVLVLAFLAGFAAGFGIRQGRHAAQGQVASAALGAAAPVATAPPGVAEETAPPPAFDMRAAESLAQDDLYGLYLFLADTTARPPAPEQPPSGVDLPAGDAPYAVQVGAFGSQANARELAALVSARGYEPEIVPEQRGGRTFYNVWIGRFDARAAAEAAAADYRARGGEAVVVTGR